MTIFWKDKCWRHFWFLVLLDCSSFGCCCLSCIVSHRITQVVEDDFNWFFLWIVIMVTIFSWIFWNRWVCLKYVRLKFDNFLVLFFICHDSHCSVIFCDDVTCCCGWFQLIFIVNYWQLAVLGSLQNLERGFCWSHGLLMVLGFAGKGYVFKTWRDLCHLIHSPCTHIPSVCHPMHRLLMVMLKVMPHSFGG